jgi:hypothetical protein
MVVADSRKAADTRLDERRVFDDNTFPPDILLPGDKHNQEVKCFALTLLIQHYPFY